MNDADLTEYIAYVLATAALGAWRPAGPVYAASETGIFYGAIGASPDRAIGVTVYATDDDLVTGKASRWVQLHFRGSPNAPRSADDMAGAAFDALHGRHHAGAVSRFIRTSSAPLGADANGRQERSDNYQIILTPTPLEAS